MVPFSSLFLTLCSLSGFDAHDPYACNAAQVRAALVGHVEWVRFARVERVPAPGEIVHASEVWEEPGGGGAVAAVQLAKLAGEATLYTALGDDELGSRCKEGVERLGGRVGGGLPPRAQRSPVVFLGAPRGRPVPGGGLPLR